MTEPSIEQLQEVIRQYVSEARSGIDITTGEPAVTTDANPTDGQTTDV